MAERKALIFQKELCKLKGSPSTLPLKKPYIGLTKYPMQSSSFHTHLSSFSKETRNMHYLKKLINMVFFPIEKSPSPRKYPCLYAIIPIPTTKKT